MSDASGDTPQDPQSPEVIIPSETPATPVEPLEGQSVLEAHNVKPPELSEAWLRVISGSIPDGMTVQTRPDDGQPKPPRSPVDKIFSMHDQVIFQLKDGRRQPVDYKLALKRASTVMDGLMREDKSKPRDELERECWLLEGIIKAAAECASNVRKPFTQRVVDRALYQVQNIRRRVLTINLSTGLDT